MPTAAAPGSSPGTRLPWCRDPPAEPGQKRDLVKPLQTAANRGLLITEVSIGFISMISRVLVLASTDVVYEVSDPDVTVLP
jgi:hypothetical protein